MAHEISTIKINGKTIIEAVFANKPAWHGLGKTWKPGEKVGLTASEALQESHLDWEIEKIPLVTEDLQTCKGYYATRRNDTKKILGVVKEVYTPFQNREAFQFLETLTQDGLEYESAFALRGGERVCVVARMPTIGEVAEGDISIPYVHVGFSHDGTGAVTFNPTSVRVVCANTDRLSLYEGKKHKTLFSLKHTGNIEARLEQARNHLAKFNKMFNEHLLNARILASKKYKSQDVQEVINRLFPKPDVKAKTTKALTIRETKIQAVRNKFKSFENTISSIEGTWYQVYNSITQAIDHSPVFNRFRGEYSQGNRYESITEGGYSDLKEQAFETCLEFSQS